MHLRSHSFAPGGDIPQRCAFARPPAEPVPGRRLEHSDNRNPHLVWEDLPEGTRSLALVCRDLDAPAIPQEVDREDRRIPADAPRRPFIHWVLVDLDPAEEQIREGEFCEGVTPGGKREVRAPLGTRRGRNDYTLRFADDPEMGGEYLGWDGPCPPWNDDKPHACEFTLYALDVERCPVEAPFGAEDVIAAIEGHVLARAQTTATCTLDPTRDGAGGRGA